MIFLKKYFQNRKGLQKLDTKHVPHSPKEETFFKAFCDIRMNGILTFRYRFDKNYAATANVCRHIELNALHVTK